MNTDEIKARLEAATEGKWDNSTNERSEHPSVIYTDIDDEGSLIVAECRTVEDGDFIAHAPTDIKWLLEEVEETKARAFRNLIRDPWISVKEKPQPTEKTHPKQSPLVWLNCGHGEIQQVYYDHYNKVWFNRNGARVNGTHWMPIPPLPEGKK